MYIRKIIAVIFSLLLISTLMVGCDSDDASSNNNGEPATACNLHGQATFAANGLPAAYNTYVKLMVGEPLTEYAAQFTDANGEYSFTDVPFGEYTLWISDLSYDPILEVLTLSTGEYVYDFELVVRFPEIMEAHGIADSPDGIYARFRFYDVRVWDAVGISQVKAETSDYGSQHTMSLVLQDGDGDGDLEGEYTATETDVSWVSSFAIRVTDTDGNLAEEFYQFEY
jgi:hypothetical protein